MKVLVVGSDKVYAIENFYVKYFRCMEIEVMHFPAQTFFYDYYQRSIFNKILFRAGVSGILNQIDKRLKECIEGFKPDVIWVFKGMEVYPSTLKWAKKKGIRLVNYNPDNPFIFTGKGSGNQYVVEALPLYDLHFTYNLEIQRVLSKNYSSQTAYLPFGFDISEALFKECEHEKEINRVCFLGNPDEKRVAFLKKLSENGISIDLYGNSWSDFISAPNININPPVYNNEFWKVLRRYRVQLNMMRIHNENSHNMRTFEVPGVGGIMIAPKTIEHEMFFTDKKESFFYDDVTECTSVAKMVLALSGEEASEIRYNARTVSLERGYQYKDRAITAWEEIKRL